MPAPDSLPSDAKAVIEIGRLSAEPHSLEIGEIYLVQTPHGIETVDLTTEDFLRRTESGPARKRGIYRFRDAESFAIFVNAHAEPGRTWLFADRDHHQVTAILDGPEIATTDTGWSDHRAILELKTTPEWDEWNTASGQFLSQEQFADFLEDHLLEIHEPSSAELLEIATTISGTKGAAFKHGVQTESGAISLRYEETVDVRAGKAGSLTIPNRLTLGIAPFVDGDVYKVTARFRYRLKDGRLSLGFVLDRPRNVLRDAFQGAVEKVKAGINLPVLFGTPSAGR